MNVKKAGYLLSAVIGIVLLGGYFFVEQSVKTTPLTGFSAPFVFGQFTTQKIIH